MCSPSPIKTNFQIKFLVCFSHCHCHCPTPILLLFFSFKSLSPLPQPPANATKTAAKRKNTNGKKQNSFPITIPIVLLITRSTVLQYSIASHTRRTVTHSLNQQARIDTYDLAFTPTLSISTSNPARQQNAQ